MDYKSIEKLQTLLPLGYFYLIVLGILKDGVFFFALGINFIKFSSITDVLMSPISDITRYPILLVAVALIIYSLFLYNKFQINNSHKNWVRNSFAVKRFLNKNASATDQEVKNFIKNQFITSILIMIGCFFLGGGLGFGISARDRIKNNDMKFNYRITYDNGKDVDVYMIDSNSVYYFYVEKGQKNITITPAGSIEKIEIIKNRMLE
ncbi:hypothetical protein LUD75_06760 [Epilithonimonas sp. JDS]|uniref:hypothetical protein n=1 Tax=Epilithonimonas sp. JDS TaxID=2902797 RepID=UPI001E4A3136|nr:hypothetical protein [Epilithonimonas sp. JDS]MCD9854398.1 hypothetical protein [Epilithonimonas sp. JDS]